MEVSHDLQSLSTAMISFQLWATNGVGLTVTDYYWGGQVHTDQLPTGTYIYFLGHRKEGDNN